MYVSSIHIVHHSKIVNYSRFFIHQIYAPQNLHLYSMCVRNKEQLVIMDKCTILGQTMLDLELAITKSLTVNFCMQ